MATGTYAITVSAGGLSISRSIARSGDGVGAVEIDVPAAAAGTLTTRTDDETGSLTMDDAGHGITTGATIDLYWSGGSRHGITVGTVSGTTVPIGADDSGTGDVLPSAATEIVADVQIPFNVAIDGDELALIGMEMTFTVTTETATSHVSLMDSGSSEIAGLDLVANQPRAWDITGGDTNAFTGNPITNGVITNGSSSNAATLRINFIQDATP